MNEPLTKEEEEALDQIWAEVPEERLTEADLDLLAQDYGDARVDNPNRNQNPHD